MAGDLSKFAWSIVWAGGLVIKVVPVWVRPWWPPDLAALVRVQPWCNGSGPAARRQSCLRHKALRCLRHDQLRRSRDLNRIPLP